MNHIPCISQWSKYKKQWKVRLEVNHQKKVQKKLTSLFSTNAFIQSENEQSIDLSEPSSTSSQPEFESDHVGISQKNFKNYNLSKLQFK